MRNVRSRVGHEIAMLVASTAMVGACGSSGEDGGDCYADACSSGSDTGGVADDDRDPDGSGGSGAEDGGPVGGGLPCDVLAVLQRNCMPCHDAPPQFGAPMSLTGYDHLRMPAISDPSLSVAEMVGERIDDPLRPMPPTEEMSPADAEVLRAWLAAGTPERAGDTCEPIDPGEDPDDVGPDALPCEPTHTFTAHAPAAEQGFSVPEVGADNLYQCFTFKSPLTEPTHITAWAPIVDDERVLHHWILYRTATPQEDGGVGPCQMPSDALFVAGWAPGGTNYALPDDVGLEFGGPDDSFILQVHYHNAAQLEDAVDASGVAFCTADTLRPQSAGIVTLGSVGINIPAGAQGAEATGTCPSWITNYLSAPLHIISSFPHMHELGRRIRTETLRGGSEAEVEMLVDVDPWSFENQAFYPHEPEVLLQPGDALRTTCTYDNPNDYDVYFGEATEDEMCFNFVMVYPVDLVGENRQCGIF